MRLEWTLAAIADLVDARAYIEIDNPHAAQELAARILEAAEGLLELPEIGRLGRTKGTRERPIANTSYVLIYRVRPGRVQILRVYHGRRRWPPRRPDTTRAV